MKIHNVATDENFETGKRILTIKDKLVGNFMFLYGDNYWPFDIAKQYETFKCTGVSGLIVAYNNRDNYSSSNIALSASSKVVEYSRSRDSKNAKFVDIGFGIFRPSVLDHLTEDENIGFEKKIYPALIKVGGLSAFQTSHRYYSLTNLDRLYSVERSLNRSRRYIFLDRDGVLNNKAKKGEYIYSWDKWTWRPGSIDALKFLSQKLVKHFGFISA